jgi:hypothetical protein
LVIVFNIREKIDCYEFYEAWQNDLPSLLIINNFIKRNNVSGKDIVNILRAIPNKLKLSDI